MSQRYCKFTQVLWASQVKHFKNNTVNLQKILFISMQNINFITQFFLEILQTLYTCYFEYFRYGRPHPQEMTVSIYGKLWWSSTSSLTSFLRYCRDFANLPFWVIWAGLAMTSKNDTISFQKTLMFVFMEKITSIPPLFLEILRRYCKLVILDTLDTSGHTHQKQ